MIQMYGPLFFMGKGVVVESGFLVSNGLVAIAKKAVHTGALIKNRWYWPKSVPEDLFGRNFSDKEVGGVDMLEAVTEDGKSFLILFFKDTDYVMKIIELWMTLGELEGGNTKGNCKGRGGDYLVKKSNIGSHLD